MVEFHALLSQCLEERYSVQPVHTLGQLELLQSRFPEEIKVVGVRDAAGGLQAACCLYLCATTVHAQYICSSPEGRHSGAVAFLFHAIMEHGVYGRRYMDFGTSNGHGGRELNAGLYAQKAGMGGSGVAYTRYKLTFLTD